MTESKKMASALGVAIALCLSVPAFAFADWWIVRSADEKCLVVDVEPTPGKEGVTKIGKDKYASAEEAEADIKRVCDSTTGDFGQ
jgi:hypothetical protein